MMVHPSIAEQVDLDSAIVSQLRQYSCLMRDEKLAEAETYGSDGASESVNLLDVCPQPTTSSSSCECCYLDENRLSQQFENGNYLHSSLESDRNQLTESESESPTLKYDQCEVYDKIEIEPEHRPYLHTSSSFEVLRNDIGPLHSKDDFVIESYLGGGFFGDVYKIRHLDDPDSEPLVMKVAKIDESRCGGNSRLRAKRNVLHEARILQKLSHPNILRSRGGCVELNGDRWDIHLLVDYCDMGSLHTMLLNKHTEMPWLLRFGIALDIANAMQFVHDSGLIHRDLTSMNVLLQSCRSPQEVKAVVADFGLSCERPVYPHKLQQVGTLNWMAPETLKEEYYDEKADVFAFGVIVCQMIARIDADHDAGLYRSHLFGLDYIRFTAHCPSDTPLDLLKLAFWCCLMNPTSRPTFSEIYEQLTAMIHTKRSEDEERSEKDSMSSPFRTTKSCYGVPDSRLGRSHSDAAIRPTELYAQSTGKRQRGVGTSLSSTTSVLPEGIAVEGDAFDSSPSVFCKGDSGDLVKQLAVSVANEDPDYAESESNPFRKIDTTKRVRKFTPKWNVEEFDRQVSGGSRDESEKEKLAVLCHCPMSVKRVKKRYICVRRTASMPNFSSPVHKVLALDEDVALSLPSKRINNAGIGAQRDLQGKMTLTFRDFDQKFTSLMYPSRRRATLVEKPVDASEHSRFGNEAEDVPGPAAVPTLVVASEFYGNTVPRSSAGEEAGCVNRTSKRLGCIIL